MGKKIARFISRFFSYLNPDLWMVKILKLSVVKEPSSRPGAVIVQIDGLGFSEFSHAIRMGELPYLSRLLKKGGYTSSMHYSGQPSSTASVQGELFYGVKMCVPAFSFKDKKTGRVFRMLVPDDADAVEKRIRNKGKALLKGGSSYGNMFTGGAAEPRFCVSSAGWGGLFGKTTPAGVAVFILMHLHVLIRAALLVIVEFFLGLYDVVRGVISGKNFIYEISYIPSRVIACAMVREASGIASKIDILRGMPVIHMNLMAYDEQAHHRGPKSRFAHWSLRAVDSLIRIVHKAALNSDKRDYQLFVYSDHGQEESVYYKTEYGRSVQEAVNEVLKKESIEARFKEAKEHHRGELMREAPRRLSTDDSEESYPTAVVTSQGDAGHIYPEVKLTTKQKHRIAARLVKDAKLPLVMISKGNKGAYVWTHEGRFSLPRDAARVFGEWHPFARETARDLVKLCMHSDCGEIVFSGFRKHAPTITFYEERGSHGGPGPCESTGFMMFPPGYDHNITGKSYTKEIREAVFRSLKTGNAARKAGRDSRTKDINLKIMSYNIHACRGRDGKEDPARIAAVIAAHNPDIICLQEADETEKSRHAEEIAGILKVNHHYHSSVLLRRGNHGNAVLSRFEMKLKKKGSLPNLINTPLLEKRGAIWVEVKADGNKVQVINTHLSLFPPEGYMQARHLMSDEWAGSPDCRGPVILCGDFNSLSNSRICRLIEKKFHSIHFHVPGRAHLKSFPSVFPLGMVDHIFLSRGIKAVKIELPSGRAEKQASDHLPLTAVVRVTAG